MAAGGTLRRELRVALSLRAQPPWFRILKWALLLTATALFWRSAYFWVCLAVALALSLTLHFIWRWKTKGWTRPWGGWDDLDAARRE